MEIVMKLKDGFVLEQVGSSYLAVAVGERAETVNALIRLNGSGAFLWRLIAERDMTEAELLDAMLGEYDVSAEIAAADIKKFLKQLSDGGLLDE